MLPPELLVVVMVLEDWRDLCWSVLGSVWGSVWGSACWSMVEDVVTL